MNAPAAPAAPRGLERAAAASFLLLALALPTGMVPVEVAAALCAALTLALWAVRRTGWPGTPVDPPALAWLAAMMLASAFSSERAASFARVGKGLLPALVALAAWHAATRERGGRAVAALLASGGVVAVYGVARWVAQGASFEERARGLAGHYMTFGGQLLLWMSVAAGVALTARTARWRLGALAAFAAGLAALAATFTRSAWIGLVVALATMLALTRPRWLVALALAVAAAVAFAPGAWHARLVSVIDPANLWNRERVLMWEAGARMFRDHPWTGVGIQDLHTVYARYRPTEATQTVGHLHNLLVQVAATMGVVGLAAFLWLYATLLAVAARGLRAQLRTGGLAAGLRLGVTGALLGFFAAGMFEWNFGDEKLSYLLYALVGLAWAARDWPADAAARADAAAGRAA